MVSGPCSRRAEITRGYLTPLISWMRTKPHEITTWCQLEADNYSHLNTFTELEFHATHTVSVSFSPCPDKRIRAPQTGYPVGQPARFACLGADGVFRVVEASSAEKGPFSVLALGDCARDHVLELTLFAGTEPAFKLRFHDFLAQCSTELSPTAGWGTPQNSIGFSQGYDPGEPAFIYFSLSSTSEGRGFDSVGHRRGIYRNRVQVEVLKEREGETSTEL